MIVDNIKNAKLYYSLHPEFKAAFECLASLTAESEAKRYEINGDNCFVNLAEYENKCEAECKYEAHAKYIDIQFMVKGKECIDCEDCAAMTVIDDKMAESDIAFYANPEKYSVATLFDGDFVIIFPEEAHRPMRAYDEKPMTVKKAVAKIKL